MKVSAYARMSGWEYLLVALVGTSLGYLVLKGFDAGDDVVNTPLPAVVVVLLVLVLFGIGSSKRRVFIGGAVLSVCLVVSLLVSAAFTEMPLTSDEPGNWLIVMLMLELCALIAYLLSRKKAGTVLLLAMTVFVCGWIQFFYTADDYLWSFAAVFSSLILVAYKNYQMSARTVSSARRVSFTAGFGMCAVVVAVAAGIGCAVWFGIVAPLNPPVLGVKLITEYRALETVLVRGTSEEYLTPNMELSSSETNSSKRTTDDLWEDEDGIDEPARPREEEATEVPEEGSFMGVDISSLQEAFDLQSNPQLVHVVVPAALLLLLAFVAYFVGRRWWRKRRLLKFQQLDPTEQVRAIYLFLMGRLGKLGYALPDGMTPLEYATHNATAFETYDKVGGAIFANVTGAYTAVAYGERAATAADAQLLVGYYKGFWMGARKQLGNFKYFFKSFRL